MSRDEPVIPDVVIKYRGIFDLTLIYNNLKLWLIDSGYAEPREIKYAEKIKPGGKDIEIIWETDKLEDLGFFKFKTSIKFYAQRINEAEVERDGNKLKLHKGDLWLTFNSQLSINANNKWQDHSIMYKLYEKYIIKDRIDYYKIQIYEGMNKIMTEVKNFLNLYTF